MLSSHIIYIFQIIFIPSGPTNQTSCIFIVCSNQIVLKYMKHTRKGTARWNFEFHFVTFHSTSSGRGVTCPSSCYVWRREWYSSMQYNIYVGLVPDSSFYEHTQPYDSSWSIIIMSCHVKSYHTLAQLAQVYVQTVFPLYWVYLLRDTAVDVGPGSKH